MATRVRAVIAVNLLSLCVAIPCIAERPSVNMLNAEVNQLQAEVSQLQAEVDALQPGALRVFDATGAEIGIFIDGGSTGFKKIFHEPTETIFGVNSEMLSLPGITLVFEDTACEGTPFIIADQTTGGYLLKSVNSSSVGFFAIENATLPTIRTIRSGLGESGCYVSNSDLSVVPVRQILDLGLTFPLPAPLYVAPSP